MQRQYVGQDTGGGVFCANVRTNKENYIYTFMYIITRMWCRPAFKGMVKRARYFLKRIDPISDYGCMVFELVDSGDLNFFPGRANQ